MNAPTTTPVVVVATDEDFLPRATSRRGRGRRRPRRARRERLVVVPPYGDARA